MSTMQQSSVRPVGRGIPSQQSRIEITKPAATSAVTTTATCNHEGKQTSFLDSDTDLVKKSAVWFSILSPDCCIPVINRVI